MEEYLEAGAPLISIENLRVSIKTDEGMLRAVRGVDLEIPRGETLGLVGESGCGKSLTCKALLSINVKNSVTEGRIVYHMLGKDVDIVSLKPNGPEIRAIRGNRISMIFQEPMTAFSPLYTIGNQLSEAARLHITKNKKDAMDIAANMLEMVGIANVRKRLEQYPHEFSGGMLQRAMIAMALICKPELLIADEPTTALDVTIQAQILEIMQDMQSKLHMGILYVTHDLGTVAAMCDKVAVMYLGQVVERGSVRDIFHDPRHPYTRGLLRSVPHMGGGKGERLASIEGVVPLPINLPDTCGFYERCEDKQPDCLSGAAPLCEVSPGHFVRCLRCAQRHSGEANHIE